MLKKIATIAAVLYMFAPMAMADENIDGADAARNPDDMPSWIMDTSSVGKDNNGVVRSNQILELGEAPPNALHLEGESMLRRGDLDNALRTLQRCVELAPGDMDKRILYSQCLEKKLMKQKHKDPVLYNFLVKQWYFIYKKSEFPDQVMNARERIAHLSGTIPKPMEREKTFLARVLIPEDGPIVKRVAGVAADATKKPAAKTE